MGTVLGLAGTGCCSPASASLGNATSDCTSRTGHFGGDPAVPGPPCFPLMPSVILEGLSSLYPRPVLGSQDYWHTCGQPSFVGVSGMGGFGTSTRHLSHSLDCSPLREEQGLHGPLGSKQNMLLGVFLSRLPAGRTLPGMWPDAQYVDEVPVGYGGGASRKQRRDQVWIH